MRNKLCCDFERKNSLEIKSTWLKYQLHVELLMTPDSSTSRCVEGTEMTVQDRAYIALIWYTPGE